MNTRQRISTVNLSVNPDHLYSAGNDDDDNVTYVGIGSNMRSGVRNQFEEARTSMSSAMTSHFPHVMAQRLPTIGPDSFPQWFSPMYVFIVYVLLFVAEGALYSFAISTAFVTYPGTDPLSMFLKAGIVGGIVTLIIVGFSRWTGGYCDPFITMMVGFMEIFFDAKWKDYRSYGIMQKGLAFFKILIACFFNWVGFLIGIALMVASQGGSVTTSDCLVDFSFVCVAQPRPFFIADSEAKWQVALGSLLIPAAFMIAYGLNKKREVWTRALTYTGIHYNAVNQDGDKDNLITEDILRQKKANKMYVPYEINDDYVQIGVIVGLAHFVAVALFSRNVGYGFNFWFWFVTSIYTGDYSHAETFAWPMLLACVIVFASHALWYLLSERSITYRRRKFEELAQTEEDNNL